MEESLDNLTLFRQHLVILRSFVSGVFGIGVFWADFMLTVGNSLLRWILPEVYALEVHEGHQVGRNFYALETIEDL